MLTKSGVDFFYHPEMDFYSGILLYDLGDQEGFVEHARFVARTLKLHGVEKVITVDPHTTYALKELYPKYTGVSFDVQPYFALLRPQEVSGGNGRPAVAIHDPCFYGRYLKLSEGPRRLLTDLGLQYAEVRNCGEFTSCCGGPAESVSPGLEPGDPRAAGGGIAGERRPGGHLLPHLPGQPAQGGPARGRPGQPAGPLLVNGRCLSELVNPHRKKGEPRMSEEKEKIVLVSTHAKEDPERAIFPLMLANAAQAMDVEAVVVLQGNGVYLAQKGYADGITFPGLTPMKTLVDNYVANGGTFLA